MLSQINRAFTKHPGAGSVRKHAIITLDARFTPQALRRQYTH